MKDWMRKRRVPLALCVLLVLPVSAMANSVAGSASGPHDHVRNVVQPAEPLRLADAGPPSLWDQTKHNAAKAWGETKHGAKRAWQGAKDLSSDAYHNAKKTVSKGVDTVEKKNDGKKNK